MTEVYRAPMRARDRDLPQFDGATHGVANDLVGIGDALAVPPKTLDEAILAAADAHGDKAGRMLARFADLPDGVFVWTQTGDDEFRLGMIDGPWRYDDSKAARAVGLHHVRPATWLPGKFGTRQTPGAVVDTFARGGKNFQRTNDDEAEALSVKLWSSALES